jgi:hypothetical protein
MDKEIIESIKGLSDTIKELQGELKLILTNPKKPLAERWDIYKQAVKENVVSEVDSYGPSLRTLYEMGVDSPYDYLYCERYQSMSYLRVVEILEEFCGVILASYNQHWKSVELTEENINKVKEEILSKFPERGFTYDW